MRNKISLYRRGHDLGAIPEGFLSRSLNEKPGDRINAWQQGEAIMLHKFCSDALINSSKDLTNAERLYNLVLQGERACEELLDETPYRSKLRPKFELLGSSINEGDEQEIETVLFDVIADQRIIAEDLWMKVSWLSFHEEDASLRFRFSFGVDLHEDVAADEARQHYASLLTDAIFPESRLISNNNRLLALLDEVLTNDCETSHSNEIKFVERIVYFNAPNGGAYLHHDRERGHAGVVFAQLTGQTFWLAIAKYQLYKELKSFYHDCQKNNRWPNNIDQAKQDELLRLVSDKNYCDEQLESFSNDILIAVINETKEFVQQLINNGYGYHLKPGDVILLPQETEANCCWHSVFCVGEQVGQALSFAIRKN